jgi:hypothetical protein
VRREWSDVSVDIGKKRERRERLVKLCCVYRLPDTDVGEPAGDTPDPDDRSRRLQLPTSRALALEEIPTIRSGRKVNLNLDEKLDRLLLL